MQADRRSRRRVHLHRAALPHTSPSGDGEVEEEAAYEALRFAFRALHETRRSPVGIIEDGAVPPDAGALARRGDEQVRERAIELEML